MVFQDKECIDFQSTTTEGSNPSLSANKRTTVPPALPGAFFISGSVKERSEFTNKEGRSKQPRRSSSLLAKADRGKKWRT